MLAWHIIWAAAAQMIDALTLHQEDELVTQLVLKYGPKRWSVISSHVKGRIGKQCRER